MSTGIIRKDEIGVRCQADGWRARPIKPDRIFSFDAIVTASDLASKLGRSVRATKDNDSAYVAGDHVKTHHYAGTQYVRVDGDKGTELWFTARDQS